MSASNSSFTSDPLMLYRLYLETGQLEDLNKSITLNKAFLERAGEEHPDWSAQLNNLSVLLDALYERTGSLVDLDEAVRYGRQSLQVTPTNAPGLGRVLGNMATSLSIRSQVTGSFEDLDQAVYHTRRALEATPEDDPTRHIQFHNMASVLSRKYARSDGDISVLNEAIEMSRKAIAVAPENHSDIDTYQHRLAAALERRHTALGSAQDLEEGIKLSMKVARAWGYQYTGRSHAVNTLALLLRKNVESGEGSLDDVDEAIKLTRKALSFTPEDSPVRTEYWSMLGGLFVSRYIRLQLKSDMDQAVDNYRSAVMHPTGEPLRRVMAASVIVQLCPEFEQSYEIGRAALDMVPMLAAVGSLETADRQYLLSHAAGLAANTAGAALKIDKQPSEALSILEKGRGLLASSLDELRTDIEDLRDAFPDLAEEFVRLRNELDKSTESNTTEDSTTYGTQGRRRRDAGRSFDELLLRIRENPGFEGFLGPLTTEQMRSAAKYGPVVVINSSWMGVEAIIIQEDQLMSKAFMEVKDFQELNDLPEHEYGSVETLETLWNAFISHILEDLGFTETPADGQNWPHIWWVPTGPFSRLLIHAAGLHLEKSGKTVMDRVISSYAPSVKALVHGRRRRKMPEGPAQALLVAMDSAQNQEPLPKTREEVDLVSKICESMKVKAIIAGSDKQDTLGQFRSSKIFHFAGHGYTDKTNPSKSHLCFSNASDPLTVANLLDLNLHDESPFLAYLSACSTGRVQDEQFLDESIQLISACQLAGFRHIIGTLWKVQDEHCVDVARITYETIKEGGMTDDSVCRGLHRATRTMRDIWLNSMEEDGNSALRALGGEREARDIISCEDDELAPAYWVPYVYHGV